MIAFSRQDAKYVCDFLQRFRNMFFIHQAEGEGFPLISHRIKGRIGCTEANSQRVRGLCEFHLRETHGYRYGDLPCVPKYATWFARTFQRSATR